jgi:hypothetical protein
VSLNVHGKYNFLNLLIMKKQILNIGKALSRAEQKQVFGGMMAAEGNCMVGCSNQLPNGDNIVVENAPDCSSTTTDWACRGAGGAFICSCTS